MQTWVGRSLLSAGLATGLGLAALLVFNLAFEYRFPMLRYGFPLAALAFHVGFVSGLVALVRRERKAWTAVAVNAPRAALLELRR